MVGSLDKIGLNPETKKVFRIQAGKNRSKPAGDKAKKKDLQKKMV
jgi:hypothetical protein